MTNPLFSYRPIYGLFLVIVALLVACSDESSPPSTSATAPVETQILPQVGQVKVQEIIIRTAPDENSTELARLPFGAIVNVIAQQGIWLQIKSQSPPSVSGWTLVDFLDLNNEPVPVVSQATPTTVDASQTAVPTKPIPEVITSDSVTASHASTLAETSLITATVQPQQARPMAAPNSQPSTDGGLILDPPTPTYTPLFVPMTATPTVLVPPTPDSTLPPVMGPPSETPTATPVELPTATYPITGTRAAIPLPSDTDSSTPTTESVPPTPTLLAPSAITATSTGPATTLMDPPTPTNTQEPLMTVISPADTGAGETTSIAEATADSSTPTTESVPPSPTLLEPPTVPATSTGPLAPPTSTPMEQPTPTHTALLVPATPVFEPPVPTMTLRPIMASPTPSLLPEPPACTKC